MGHRTPIDQENIILNEDAIKKLIEIQSSKYYIYFCKKRK